METTKADVEIRSWRSYSTIYTQAHTFEDTIGNYKFFDPSGSIQADAFGFSILSYASTQNPSSPIVPEVIQNSMEDVFATIYAGLATNLQLQPANTPSTGSGELSTPVTRLYVVTPVAYTIVAILSLIFICNIALFVYAERHHSILYEQPTGLLGNASIVEQSDLPDFVSEFRKQHGDEYQIRKFVGDNYTTKEARCYLEASTGKIRVEGLELRSKEQGVGFIGKLLAAVHLPRYRKGRPRKS